jgi:predicted RNA binding protein YcfA (HicA-like mRNA interferase family)
VPRLTPQHWRTLECVFLCAGFTLARKTSSHRVYEKPGTSRPVIIPEYEEIDVRIIAGLLRTAGMSRNEYFNLLSGC